MNQTARGKLALFLLFFGAAAVFIAGINWGLPSRSVDRFFIAPDAPELADSTIAYRLSGTGIDQLAGNWEEDPNRGADVALHPITDRSKPVTLVANAFEKTGRQIADEGDQQMATLLAAEKKAQDSMDELNKDTVANADKIPAAESTLKDASNAAEIYIDRYNQSHTPGLVEAEKNDAIGRARILRRYRLYSSQPDEMITFRSLAQMKPDENQFDPRLYQYGGLWIYPIGALLKGASICNLLTVSGDRAFYLDHPEQFARFYMVARAYTVFWGLVALGAVFGLLRRFTDSITVGVIGALCFIAMPVVLNGVHEAKPHLPGAALLLVAVLAGVNYIQSGKFKWMLLASISCGLAVGMVLSALAGVILIPALAFARRGGFGRFLRDLLFGLIIVVVVYFASNPYVAVHLFRPDERGPLISNLGNTKAMYSIGEISRSALNAAKLIAIGTSGPLAIAGLLGILLLMLIRRRHDAESQVPPSNALMDAAAGVVPAEPLAGKNCACSGIALLVCVAIATLVPFTLFAAGKPGEYARFGLFGDIALMILAVAGLSRLFGRCGLMAFVGLLLVAATGLYGYPYERGFIQDSMDNNTRISAASALQKIRESYGPDDRPTLGLTSEPAPYSTPAFDLYHWKIVLLPQGSGEAGSEADVKIGTLDELNVWQLGVSPISWADKPFWIEHLTPAEGTMQRILPP